MKDSVVLRHKGKMAFEATVNGHKLILDANAESGGNNDGPRPKSLMLTALAGCTGMDVVAILGKMKVDYDDFSVVVEGNITEDHPRHFDHMHIKYIIKGNEIPEDKVLKAINLSQDKYCGVSYNYKQAMKVTWELVIES
ncbi:MAG: OsmC family protein [Bacteroidales bacterium]